MVAREVSVDQIQELNPERLAVDNNVIIESAAFIRRHSHTELAITIGKGCQFGYYCPDQVVSGRESREFGWLGLGLQFQGIGYFEVKLEVL